MFRRLLLALAVLAGSPASAVDSEPVSKVKICDPGEVNCATVDGSSRLKVDSTQNGTWTTGRTWTLLNSTDSVNAVQSGTWTAGRTWTLSNGTDSIAAVQSGTWAFRLQDGSGNAITSQASSAQRALDVGIDVAGVQVDPRTRTWNLSSADVPLVSQGTAAAASGGWPVKVTDGTSTAAVKAASTAPGASDPALVVVQSPNGNHATAANQTTEITSLQVLDDVVGSKAGGTAGTQSSLAGGIYNTTRPTLTNGQQAALQSNSSAVLLVDGSTANGFPMLNRVDVSTTASSAGNSGTLDTAGLNAATYQLNITSISGSGAYIQLHLQSSEDGTNWSTLVDNARLTATGVTRYGTYRVTPKYYRYAWDIAGTTPSVTFAITTTLKAYEPTRKATRFFYSDLDLQTNGNMSSTFGASNCSNVAVLYMRGADGGNNGTVQLFGSIDGTTWVSVSGNLAANVSTTNSTTLAANAWPNLNLEVTAHTNVGTRVLDIQWSCF